MTKYDDPRCKHVNTVYRVSSVEEGTEEFDRWLLTVNSYPLIDVRYDAAKAMDLGGQLTDSELTERVRIQLTNAFAAGAMWQYFRAHQSAEAATVPVGTK